MNGALKVLPALLIISVVSCGDLSTDAPVDAAGVLSSSVELGTSFVLFEDDYFRQYMTTASGAGGLIFWTEEFYWTYLGVEPKSIHAEKMARFAEFVADSDMEVYLGVNLMAYSRDRFNTPLPETAGKPGFRNPVIRRAFALECRDILAAMQNLTNGKVKYMALTMEANFYKRIDPEDYENLVDAIVETKRILKAAFPDVEYGVYFALGVLWEEHFDNPNVYAAMVGDHRWATMDFVGGSAYPEFSDPAWGPSDVPRDYYALAVNASRKPFHIPELGWSSGGRTGSGFKEQRLFIENFFNRQIAGLGVKVVIWFVLSDFPSDCPLEFRPFGTMGLWERGFVGAKPGWEEWINKNGRNRRDLPI